MTEPNTRTEGRRSYDRLAKSLEEHLVDCAESNARQNNAIESLVKDVASMRDEMKPMLEIYRGASFGARAARWTVSFLIGLGTLLAMLYGGFRWFKSG